MGREGYPSTWRGNPGPGLNGLVQGDVDDLTGIRGTCRARFCSQGGGDAVGAPWALPEAGEGGIRDWDWGSSQLLSGPHHSHIQRIIAHYVADEGGWQSFVCQTQLYFGGS